MNRTELLLCILFIVGAFSMTALLASESDDNPQLAQITVSVSPKLAEVVVTTQKQQFRATVTGDPNNLGVRWTVDGITGGNATVGQISAAGLYSPPAKAGSHVVAAHSIADNTKSGSATIKITDLGGVLTYHNNRSRDGTNTHEYALSPQTVSQATFGKRFSCTLDGAAYTQPLWMPHVNIGGSMHNLVFVGTEHDTAYAFDADHIPCLKIWRVSLLGSLHGGTAGETPVPAPDVEPFLDIQPEIGVTGTPVIDPASKTLYIVSTSEGPTGSLHQRLHALDVTTGAEKFGGPITVSASVPGTGYESSRGSISFNPRTLSNGVIYVAWASYGDRDPYHGWIIGYDARTLVHVAAFADSSDGQRGGIWMSGGAPAIDANGNLFLATGNGTFDANSNTPPNADFGNTVLKLSPAPALAVTDWFTPFDQSFLNLNDGDLGSSGVLLLPNQPFGPPHLLVSGRDGKIRPAGPLNFPGTFLRLLYDKRHKCRADVFGQYWLFLYTGFLAQRAVLCRKPPRSRARG